MATDKLSTRRSFLATASGAAVVPLAVLTGPAAAQGGDRPTDRLAELEDREAIGALHARLLQHINAGTLESGAADMLTRKPAIALGPRVSGFNMVGDGRAAEINRAPDGGTATVTYPCRVQTEIALEPNCTEAVMALAQGSGIRASSRAALVETGFVKEAGLWKVQSIALHPAEKR